MRWAWGIQRALYDALTGQLGAGVVVYDAVDTDASGAYVVLGETTELAADTHSDLGTEETATLHVWVPEGWQDRYGSDQAKGIMSLVDQQLHHAVLTLPDDLGTVQVTRDFAEVLVDETEPGEAWHHGVLRYRVKTLSNAAEVLVDPYAGHVVTFTGLVGSMALKAGVAAADASIVLGAGDGRVWKAEGGEDNDGHAFTLVTTLPAGVNWLVRAADDSLLAGLDSGDLYRSTDAGDTWALQGSIAPVEIREGALIQTQAGTLLAGGNDGNVYRSTDLGVTWTDLGQLNGATNVRELLELSGGAILAGLSTTPASIYRSTDDGLTWGATTPPASNLLENVMAMAEAEDGSVIAHGSTDGDLWRSTDAGLTWAVQEAGGATGVLVLAAYRVPTTGTLLTMGTAEQPAPNGPTVRRSTDNGVSFTPTHGQAGQGVTHDQHLSGQENGRAFLETPTFGAVLALTQGTKPAWRSTDDGDTWTDPTT